MTNFNATLSFRQMVTYDSKYELDKLNFSSIPCKSSLWYAYYIGGISTTTLCTFAILGNLICLVVLSRPVMKSSVNFILVVLSASDLLQVVCSLLMRGIPRIFEGHCIGKYYTFWLEPVITPYLFPLGTTAQVASVYLTILVSIERYVAVCKPFMSRVWFSRRQSALFSISVIFFSICYNLPTWFELKTKAMFSDNKFLGLAVVRTSLYMNPTYVFYYVNLGSFLVIRLIPFVLLVVLNGFIYRGVVRMNRSRKSLTQFQCHEVSVARMLLCIVLVFLMCNLATLMRNMLEAFNFDFPSELTSASNFLVMLSAGANFIIYCFLSRNFRKVLLQQLTNILGATWGPMNFRGQGQTRPSMFQSARGNTARTGTLATDG